MFRWLIEQRYVLANPFAGLKVRGAPRSGELDASRAFSEGEWALVRVIAGGLEWSHGWTAPAAQRLRFLLDFGYATGMRAGELVGVTLGGIETGPRGERWLHLRGKGAKPGKVVLPSLASEALDQYLQQRGLPVSEARWNPATPLIGVWRTRPALPHHGCERCCAVSSGLRPLQSKPIIRCWPVSCGAPHRTG